MMANAAASGIRLEGVNASQALVFLEAPGLDVRTGDWVILDDDVGGKVGRVIVAPGQVVESALGESRQYSIRPAHAHERPARRRGAGGALLDSLGLPDSAIGSACRGGSSSAAQE